MGKSLVIASISLVISAQLVSFSQTTSGKSVLQLNEIMKGHDFVGHLPQNIRWNESGKGFYIDWNIHNDPSESVYYFETDKLPSLPVTSEHHEAIKKVGQQPYFEFDVNQVKYKLVYKIINNALVSYDRKTDEYKVVYQTSDNLLDIQRVQNENLVYFQSGFNLYEYNALNGSVLQKTNFIKGTEEAHKKTGTSYLVNEEEQLFQYIREQKELENWMSKNSTNWFKMPAKYFTGNDYLMNLQISSSAKFVTFLLSNYPENKQTYVENYISQDGYAYQFTARPKVTNTAIETNRLAIHSLENDSTFFVDFSGLSDIRKKPLYLNDTSRYPQDRSLIIHGLHFSQKSDLAICDVRVFDNKDRWIVLIDLKTGKVMELDHQHDEAWIGGPGIGEWNSSEGTIGWLVDDETIYFQSEKTGYSHLYTMDIRTKTTTALTEGKWEVHEATLSNNRTKFYIIANKNNAGNREFYQLAIASKTLIPVLTTDGAYKVSISPDEKSLALLYSYKNKPWEVYLAKNVPNATLTQVTHSTTKEFEKYPWRTPELLTFKASDGKDVYARLYKPNPNVKNNAAVQFVHGAGYLQNATNYWSYYFREYMFHNLLVDNGFTVIDIDYRASEGYGRDYRTAIYRHMGGRDLEDQLDGKNYLVKELGIDSNKVGIYGGSYGGFITLMALLTTKNQFKCGAALRSVTDWAHYNQEYSSNILNYPETDPEAYKKSSPIYYANQLNGKLLMLHGMVDDNVQFQDIVRLSQRFIELGKENWELAVFPVESHGFVKNSSWMDEYRRIYELFTNELLEKKTK